MSTATGTAHGRLVTTEGVVSVSIGGNAHMDAAVAAGNPSIAGIELSIEEARVTIGPRSDYRGDLTLVADMHRDTMERLLYLLAAKLDLPAFNERQWRMIVKALRSDSMSHIAEAREMAEQIDKAYS
jgi:hypothetical protein